LFSGFLVFFFFFLHNFILLHFRGLVRPTQRRTGA